MTLLKLKEIVQQKEHLDNCNKNLNLLRTAIRTLILQKPDDPDISARFCIRDYQFDFILSQSETESTLINIRKIIDSEKASLLREIQAL